MAEKGKILFICDDIEASRYLEEQLTTEGGHYVVTQESLSMGLSSFSKDNFDLVILKLDNAEILAANSVKEFKRIDKDSIIIVLLDEAKPDLLEYLSSFGVYDFIIKPINLEKLLFLVRKGLELRSLILVNRKFIQGLQESNQSLQKQNTVLAKRIEDSTRNLTRLYEDLRTTYMRTIKVLAQAIEARDHYTHSHSENVAKYATVIASEMGLSAKEIETIRQACELHDLGKIGIEDSILMKPEALTKEEWVEIRKHPVIGATILEPLTFLSDVIELVRQHHEHYDGSGYPDGKKGEEISLGARILILPMPTRRCVLPGHTGRYPSLKRRR